MYIKAQCRTAITAVVNHIVFVRICTILAHYIPFENGGGGGGGKFWFYVAIGGKYTAYFGIC